MAERSVPRNLAAKPFNSSIWPAEQSPNCAAGMPAMPPPVAGAGPPNTVQFCQLAAVCFQISYVMVNPLGLEGDHGHKTRKRVVRLSLTVISHASSAELSAKVGVAECARL